MNETLTPKHNHQEALLEAPERQERITAHAEHVNAETPQQHIERLSEARLNTESQAVERGVVAERIRKASETAPAAQPQQINRELKAITLRRELQMIRRKLPAPERVLSRVIHQPTVRAVSEGASKTINRPSGMLGGGIVAFVGSAAYVYLAQHIGFEYNYFVFLALFAGGFVLGLSLELLVYVATGSRRKIDS